MATNSVPDTWASLSDSLVGGIAHALSNRIATLSALSELMRMGDMPTENADMLRNEVGRLESIVQHLRLLGDESATTAEALQLPEVTAAAVVLHGYHRDFRDVTVVVGGDITVQPVHVARSRIVRVLLMLLAASAMAAGRDHAVHATFSGEGASVRLTLGPDGAEDWSWEPSDALIDGARAFLTDDEGSVSRDGSTIRLELPSLAAVRTREREGA
ncbi:MAG TPA: hypothetical protein VMM77_10255 [Gemmatimonadaceae bacterium]|nr:hypothetical protein [Gemmatimonadaceae bacterium]